MNQQALSSFIWSVADLLRGDYRQSEYGKVILPFTVLRRLDCEFKGPGSNKPYIGAIVDASNLVAETNENNNAMSGATISVYINIAPEAPTIGIATAGNSEATVTFSPPLPNGGPDITGYTVSSLPAGGVDSNAGTTALSHVITGLTNGTAYTFTVTATNVAGTSAASAESNSVTPATVPDAPVIGTATAGNAEATVNFTAPASDGGSAITGYTANSNPDGITGTCTTSPCSVTGLTNGTAYTFTVTATNEVGTGAASEESNSVTPAHVLNVYYIYPDQLGTPRQITDTNDNVVWQWDNTDPFGANMPNQNPVGLGSFTFNLRFPGQYYDAETNTHYNVNRDYDPAIGRYLQSDPIGLGGGINTYTYVSGNPLRYTDPRGLELSKADILGLGALAGGAGAFLGTYSETGNFGQAVSEIPGAQLPV